MKDVINGLYWKDPKYPKRLIALDFRKNLSFSAGKGESRLYSYDILIPIPFRKLNLQLAFPNYIKTGRWGKDELDDERLFREFNQKGPTRMAKELKEYWDSKDKHLGWEWVYPLLTLHFPLYKFYKLDIYYQSIPKLIKEGHATLRWLHKSNPRVRVIFDEKRKEDKILGRLKDQIFTKFFPEIVQYDLWKNWKDLIERGVKSSYNNWYVREGLSYCLGLYPLTDEQNKKPLELPWIKQR